MAVAALTRRMPKQNGRSEGTFATHREVGGHLVVNSEVRVYEDGKIHLAGLKALEEPPSLVDLRTRSTAMLPRIDPPEAIQEVMTWVPELPSAAHSMNVESRPIAKKGVPALERSRLSHVFQNYVRPETLAAANVPLLVRQAGLDLAQAWGAFAR